MKIVYFGDSITAGFTELEQHPNVINLGVSGDKINNLIGRVESVFIEKPDRLLIMIGINDYLNVINYWGSPINLDIPYMYDTLINMLVNNLLDTDIFCVSILPVSMDLESDLVKQYNDDIIELNQSIEDLCSKYDLGFIDLHSRFLDNNMVLSKEFTTDGIHLSVKGYEYYYSLIKDLLI